MGHYIRFIHNRDLAGENIVTACVRSRMILSSPAGVIDSLLRRLKAMGFTLPAKSILSQADHVQSMRGDIPGAYASRLQNTRRNTRAGPTPPPVEADLARLLRTLAYPARYKPLGELPCQRMTNGVSLNGRKYKQGPNPSLPSFDSFFRALPPSVSPLVR